MSATKEFCIKQVKRLAVAPLFRPATQQASQDWLDTLMRHCQSDGHAETVITEFLTRTLESQNPLADVVAIAERTRRIDQPPPGCWLCEIGPDVATGEMRWYYHVPVERKDGQTGAGRCLCARGRWLAAHNKGRPSAEPFEEQRQPARGLTAACDVKTLAGGTD